MLANKSCWRIARLPDKGNKIRTFCEQLRSEVVRRTFIENATDQFSNLQIKISDHALSSLEWNKEVTNHQFNSSGEKIGDICQNSKPNLIAKETIPDDATLIIYDELDVYSKNIMTLEANKQSAEALNFKPFYTTKSDVHNPKNEKFRKRFTDEITSATPPALQHEKPVKLSLYDSIQLQIKQNANVQKIQRQNTAERMQRVNNFLKDLGVDTSLTMQPNEQFSMFFAKYRDENSSDSEQLSNHTDSDLEEFNEDAEHRDGGVNVIVYSDV